ncbi:MAG: flagellar assembly peptidoglycan hydrolase FlgJ [Pseudomonadaceae bacterium]|nr:flagellar assembly peptidoglycan hydrolase FlgJ [Pseudomonadaceae bacterium]
MNAGVSVPGDVLPPSVAYADIRLRADGANSDATLKQAASQFESLFLNLMLKNMRSATASLNPDNYLSSSAVEIHQEMLDQQYASNIAESGGVGLAEAILRQLGGGADGKARHDAAELSLPSPRHFARSAPRAVNDDGAAPVETKAPSDPRQALFADKDDFVAKVGSAIKRAVAGTPFQPIALLAQAALETGWGEKVMAAGRDLSSHNLFGIKAGSSWQGETVSVESDEFMGGRMVSLRDEFRAYDSIEASVRDYVSLITGSSRYEQAVESAGEPRLYADALAKAGYATDPAYAEKIQSIVTQLERDRDGIAF